MSNELKGPLFNQIRNNFDAVDLYEFTVHVRQYTAKLDFGCERVVFGQDVRLLVNYKEVISVSQLIDMLHSRIPWGSRQREKLVWRNMSDTYVQIEHSHEL